MPLPPNRVLALLETVASHGVPGPGAALLDVGTGPYLESFGREVLDELVARGGATCRFFEGPYGSGKTHLLRLITDMGLERGYAVAEAELSRSLPLEDWYGITRYVLETLQLRVGDTEVRSLPSIVEALGRLQAPVDLAAVSVPHTGFRRAMGLAMEGSSLRGRARALLRAYLMGERVSTVEMRMNGIHGVRAPLTRRNAEQVLNTVVTTLHAIGVPGTILTFDENEHTFSYRGYHVPKRVTLGANLMRRLIDACPTGRVRGLLAAFAVLPGFLQACSDAYPALGQRLAIDPSIDGVAWRYPVLHVADVAAQVTPETFLEGAAGRMRDLVDGTTPGSRALHERLLSGGRQILERHAGPDYRRPLMKHLASVALHYAEESA